MSAGIQSAVRAYHKVCRADLRDQLILEHLSFVRHILGRMLGSLPEHVDSENLESAGILGLVEAAGQFDPTRGVAFTTFAYRRIKGAIVDELRRNCPLPQKMLQTWALIREKSADIELPLTSEKISAATGLSIDHVEECLAAIRLTRPENWTDELCEIPNPDDRILDGEAASFQMEQREILIEAISQLPDNMRNAVAMYHYEDMRMKEIGEVLELSESRVSRLLAEAELRLRTSIIRMMSDVS
ncbi:MAG: sigma-70 family RNA polymerase sigma factor [Planctomycetaceae bacterium]|nr:sigma-70 family RNA polymerase sigma factor [Planctomycetaceae bacterium]